MVTVEKALSERTDSSQIGFDIGSGGSMATAPDDRRDGRIKFYLLSMDSTDYEPNSGHVNMASGRDSESRMRENRLYGLMRGEQRRSLACGLSIRPASLLYIGSLTGGEKHH